MNGAPTQPFRLRPSLVASALTLALTFVFATDAPARGARGSRPRATAPRPRATAPRPRATAPRMTAPSRGPFGGGYARRPGGVRRGGGYARGYRNRTGRQNQNNGQFLAELRSVMSQLAQTNRDYQGHRVKALNHVGSAVRQLEPASVRRNTPNPAAAFKAAGAGAGAGKNTTPQAASDAHLRNALQGLNVIGSQLITFGTSQNHARALGSVQNAVRELNLALNAR